MKKYISILFIAIIFVFLNIQKRQLNAFENISTLDDLKKAAELISSIEDIDSNTVNDLVQSLKQKANIPVLLKALNDESDNTKALAALLLSEMGVERSVKPLKKHLAGDSIFMVAVAAKALGDMGYKQQRIIGVKKLTDMLRDSKTDTTHRLAIVVALGIVGHQEATLHIINFMKEQDKIKFSMGIPYKVLGDIGDSRAVPFIVYEINNKQLNYLNFTNAISALLRIGNQEAISSVIDFIRNPENRPVDCWNASALIQQLPRNKKRPLYLKLLDNPHAIVRTQIIELIVEDFPDCQSLQILLKIDDERHQKVVEFTEAAIRNLKVKLGDRCDK